jgi:hypothetical protein
VRFTEILRKIHAHSDRAAIGGRVMRVRRKAEAKLREPTQLRKALPWRLHLCEALVTETALAQLRLELRRVRARLAALHEGSMAAPLDQRRGIGVVLAMRRWEPKGFK